MSRLLVDDGDTEDMVFPEAWQYTQFYNLDEAGLQDAGDKGWELVSVNVGERTLFGLVGLGDCVAYTFKRRFPFTPPTRP